MKTKIKILASAVLTLAVLITCTLTAAAESAFDIYRSEDSIEADAYLCGAQDGADMQIIYIDSDTLYNYGSIGDASATPLLADGSHVKWIDRLDLTGAEYARELYDWLVENSDGDGTDDALIDPTQAEIVSERRVYTLNITADIDTYPSEEFNENMSKVAAYVNAAYDAFDRDHPEVFWLGGKRSVLSGCVANGSSYTQKFYFLLEYDSANDEEDFDIRATDAYKDAAAIRSAIAERDAAVEEILGGMTATDTEGKIKYFNNRLTTNNCYNGDIPSATPNAWECVSALLGKTGADAPVCEGYARAFKVLCDKAGIPCVLENGPAFSSLSAYNTYVSNGTGGQPHMWNTVKVGGFWYGVDVTWNDPTVSGVSSKESGYENENYLLVGSGTQISRLSFSKSHYTTNIASVNGVPFTNAPVMSAEKYVSGYVCPHDFSSENIICSLCGEKAYFEVSGEGGSAYYISAEEAFADGRLSASAQAAGATVKLLAEAGSTKVPLLITTSAKFTLDLNGKTLYGTFEVAAGGDIIIKDSAGGGYISGAGSAQAATVSGGKLSLYCAVNGLLFERGALELGAGAACGGAGLTIGEGNVFTVSGAPAEKITVVMSGTGTFAVPAAGVTLKADWFATNESDQKIVFAENGADLALKLILPEFTLGLSEATYDGKVHKPSVTLNGLTENVDYTVSYKRDGEETANFVSAGTVTVTVTGIGDYVGEAQKTFTISKAALTAENFEIILKDNIYDGKEKKLDIRADINGTGIAKYKLGGAYAAPVSAGVYEVYMTVDESENHLAATELYIGAFEIFPREITVTANDQVVVQNGTPDASAFTVGGNGLVGGHAVEIAFAKVSTAEFGEKELAIEKAEVKDVLGADISANYKITLTGGKMTVIPHEHEWSYEAEGTLITAACEGEGPCPSDGMGYIKINAPYSSVYDGGAHEALLEGGIAGVDMTEITVTYQDANGNYVKAPNDVGTYTAFVTFGGATAKVEYKVEYLVSNAVAIQKSADGIVTVNAPEGYTISSVPGGENAVWSDFLTVAEGENTVTYYLKNSQGQITDAKTITIGRGIDLSSVVWIAIASVAGVLVISVAVAVIVKKLGNIY